ncbi:MAG: alpha/beta hydrolase [Candidatus Methanospirareceae archaeon]
MIERVEFFSEGKRIIGNLHLPFEGAPCIVLCHGLVSNKDSDKWVAFAERLYKGGYASLRFNFRGCGSSNEFSEGKLADSILTARVRDYVAALDFLESTKKVNMERIGVIGSSFGGCVAIVAKDPRVKAYVIMATPYNLRRSEEILRDFGEKLYEDFARYDIGEAISNLKRPILIIHGDKDDIVSVEDAERLYDKAGEPKKLEIIKGGNHVFSDASHLGRIFKICIKWFDKYLKS